MFQYQIWKKSLDAQYIIEAIVVLTLAVLMLAFSHLMYSYQIDVENQYNVIVTLENQIPAATSSEISSAYNKIKNISDNYLTYLYGLQWLSLLTILYFIKDIQELVYANIRHVQIKTFNKEILMNIACSTTVIYWIIKNSTDFTKNLSNVRSELRAYTMISRMQQDSTFNIKIVLAVLITIQFIRLVFALEVNRTFGPMIKILGSMIVDILIFLLMYVSIFFIFIGSSALLFQELPEFKNVGEASKTLFASSLGGFNYSIFDDMQDLSPTVGYVFLTIFLIFTMIMLMNFLIAILSNTYTVFNDVKNALYLRKVLYLRQRYNYDRYYSAMIYATPPLNLISFFMMPFIIYCKSRKFNRVLLIIQYILIGAFSVLLFFLGSLVMAPFAY